MTNSVPCVELVLDRPADGRVHVAGEQRAEAHVVVDVPVAVDVFHPGALRRAHDDRVGVVGLEARRHAEGQHLAGPIGGQLRTAGALGVGAQLTRQ